MLDQLESRHVGQPEIHDAAVEGLAGERPQRLGARRRRGDADVVMGEELGEPLTLPVVVHDDHEPLGVRRDVGLEAVEGLLEVLGRRRFHQIGECAV